MSIGPPAQTRVVCVLGMHRSGTSLVARLLNLLGVELGPESLIATPAPDNPRGFWEHPEFRQIDEAILERLGGRWDAPPPLPGGWHTSSALDDLRQQARRAIAQFSTPLWGWKSPCTCLTLPFWMSVLEPGSVTFVLVTRDILDVAASLDARNGLDVTTGAGLWLTYTLAAFRQSRGHRRLVVSYPTFIRDPEGATRRLAEFAGCLGAWQDPATRHALIQTVEADLQHHATDPFATLTRPEIPFAVRALSVLLGAVADDPLAGENGEGWDALLAEAMAAHETAVANAERARDLSMSLATAERDRDVYRDRAASLERELAAATSGAGWRALAVYRRAVERLLPRKSPLRRAYAGTLRRMAPRK